MKFKLVLLLLAVFGLNGCATVYVGNNKLKYKELCGKEKASVKCRSEGLWTKRFKKRGVPVASDRDGSEFLGRLWHGDSPYTTFKCLTSSGYVLQPSDYSITYPYNMKRYLYEESELEADIKADVESVLVANNVDDAPSLSLNIATNISRLVKNENYMKSWFKVITLKDPGILDDVNSTHVNFKACYEELNNSDALFIKSVAVITGEDKFRGVSNTGIETSISAKLRDAKISNSAISSDLRGSIKVKLKTKVEERIEGQLKKHSRIYDLGFWKPRFINNDRFDNCVKNYGCKSHKESTYQKIFSEKP